MLLEIKVSDFFVPRIRSLRFFGTRAIDSRFFFLENKVLDFFAVRISSTRLLCCLNNIFPIFFSSKLKHRIFWLFNLEFRKKKAVICYSSSKKIVNFEFEKRKNPVLLLAIPPFSRKFKEQKNIFQHKISKK